MVGWFRISSFRLVQGLIATMTKEEFHGPVNLGNPVELTMIELAKLVIELTGAKSKLVHEKLPQDDPTRRRPDITVARSELNWSPQVEVRDGLERTIKNFEQRLREGRN
jgi:UDP-glucuronate decarboxylase